MKGPVYHPRLLGLASPGVPAPQMATEQDLDIDRRRPRTLVEDFIKDARPYEGSLPPGVAPAPEVLQHFPANSYEKCVRAADARADPSPLSEAVESSHAGADDAAPDRRAYDVSYARTDGEAYAGSDG